MTDIDRIDPGRAAGQKHIGEASSGGAQIETDLARRIDSQMPQRKVELYAASGNPGMIAFPKLQQAIFRELLAGFREEAPVALDLACSDQGLGPASAVSQASRHKQEIGPHLDRHER